MSYDFYYDYQRHIRDYIDCMTYRSIEFIHIYKHTPGLDSVIDDDNNGNSEEVVVL